MIQSGWKILEFDDLNIKRVIFKSKQHKNPSSNLCQLLVAPIYTAISPQTPPLSFSYKGFLPHNTWETECVVTLLNKEMKNSKDEDEWEPQRMKRPYSAAQEALSTG